MTTLELCVETSVANLQNLLDLCRQHGFTMRQYMGQSNKIGYRSDCLNVYIIPGSTKYAFRLYQTQNKDALISAVIAFVNFDNGG